MNKINIEVFKLIDIVWKLFKDCFHVIIVYFEKFCCIQGSDEIKWIFKKDVIKGIDIFNKLFPI